MTRIDIVTVAFAGDLPLLDLQARSFARFLPSDLIDRIRVIINDPAEAEMCRTHVEAVTRPLLGPLAERLVVHMAELPAAAGPDGWKAQQAAKIAVAASVEASHYLILDAKNHLIRTLTLADLFDGERMRWPVSRSTARMRKWMANSREFFGLRPARKLKIPPSAPPFLMRAETARELMREIETRAGLPLGGFFAAEGDRMTEFMLYAAYIASRARTRAEVAPTGIPQPMMRRSNPRAEAMPGFIEQVRMPEVWTLSVHRRRFLDLDRDAISREAILDIWTDCGLFDDRAGAEAQMRELIDFYGALRGTPEMAHRLSQVAPKKKAEAEVASAPEVIRGDRRSLWSRIRPHLRLFATTYLIGFVLALLFVA